MYTASAWVVALALFTPASASAATPAYVVSGRRDSSDSLNSRRGSATEDMFTSRRSSVTDTCAFPSDGLTARTGTQLVPTDKCLCTSGIDKFIQSSHDAAQIDALSPEGDLHNAIASIITRSPTALTCDVPANSHLIDPCGDCETACNKGHFDNGDGCVAFVKRAPSGMKKRQEIRPLVTRCKRGTSACGIPGQFGRSECLDTSADLENCGGCSTPVTNHNGTHTLTTADGQNCAAIPHVIGVQCAASTCQVSSCQGGYRVSKDGTSCVPKLNGKMARLAGPIPLSKLGVASA